MTFNSRYVCHGGHDYIQYDGEEVPRQCARCGQSYHCTARPSSTGQRVEVSCGGMMYALSAEAGHSLEELRASPEWPKNVRAAFIRHIAAQSPIVRCECGTPLLYEGEDHYFDRQDCHTYFPDREEASPPASAVRCVAGQIRRVAVALSLEYSTTGIIKGPEQLFLDSSPDKPYLGKFRILYRLCSRTADRDSGLLCKRTLGHKGDCTAHFEVSP